MGKKVNNKEDKNLLAFAELVMKKMKEIKADWKQPWFNSKTVTPRNISGREYSFGNALMLYLLQESRKYELPVYMTFHQATEEGVSVRKGEKAFPIYYWNFTIKNKDGKKISIDDYKAMTKEEKDECKVIPFLKYFQVFNVDQTTMKDLKPERYEELKKGLERPLITDEEGRYASPEIDLMLKDQTWVCPIHCQESNQAFYSLGKDEITVPLKGQYPDAKEFYSTLLHEMAHSTGAEKRLNRPYGFFGDEAYAREELIAELTSGLVGVKMGMNICISDNNISYLNSWMKNLSDDPKYILSILGDVSKAGEMIEGVVFSQEEKEKIKENAINDINEYMDKKEAKTKQYAPVLQPESISIRKAVEEGRKLKQASVKPYASVEERQEDEKQKMAVTDEKINEKKEETELSPIVTQYKELKLRHPDAMLLFRCGDFYEVYKEDAEKASKILGITLTQRNSVLDENGKPLKMAGFPAPALDTYLPKLIRAGQRVAICEHRLSDKEKKQNPDTEKKPAEKGLLTAILDDGINLWEKGDWGYKGKITTDRKVILEDKFTEENTRKIKELAKKGNMLTIDKENHTMLALKPLNEPTKLQVNLQTGEINRLSVETFTIDGNEYRAACDGMKVVAEMDEIDRLPDLTEEKLEELSEHADKMLEEARDAIVKSVMYSEPWELELLQKDYHIAARLKLQDEYNEEQVQRVVDEIIKDADKAAVAMYEERNRKLNENKNHSINQTDKSMEENQKTQEEKVLKDGVNIFKMKNGFYGINVVKDGERSATHRLSQEDTEAYFDGLKGQPFEEVNRRREELAKKYFAPAAEKQQTKEVKPLEKISDEVRKRISEVSVFKMQDGKNYAVRAKIDGEQMSATRIYPNDRAAFFEGFSSLDQEGQLERKAELAAKYFRNELQAEKQEVKVGMSR